MRRFIYHVKKCKLLLTLIILGDLSVSCIKAKVIETTERHGLEAPHNALGWDNLADGVFYKYKQNHFSSNIHLVKFELDNKNVSLSLSEENSRGKTTLNHALENKSLVAMNASFFDGSFNPRGITITNGNLWQNFLLGEESPFLACTAALRCSINHNGSEKINPNWYTAVGGKQSLIIEGRIRSEQDDLNCGNFCKEHHPRTAVGLTPDNKYLILLVAEGRRLQVSGLTLRQVALTLHDSGAHNAINLDGGASSSLVVGDKQVSKRPLNETENRKVSNSLLLIGN